MMNVGDLNDAQATECVWKRIQPDSFVIHDKPSAGAPSRAGSAGMIRSILLDSAITPAANPARHLIAQMIIVRNRKGETIPHHPSVETSVNASVNSREP